MATRNDNIFKRFFNSKHSLNVFHLASSTAFQTVIAFTANLILVRLLSPSEFGTYALIIASVGIFTTIFSFRLSVHIIRKTEIKNTELSTIHTLTVIEIILIATATLVITLSSSLEVGVALMIVMTQVLATISGIQKSVFERRMNYKFISIAEGGSALLGHIFAIGLAAHGAGFFALFARDFLTVLLNIFFTFKKASWPHLQFTKIREIDFRGYFRDMGLIYLDQNFEVIFTRIRLIIIETVGGMAAVGLYFQAERLAVLPHQLLQPSLSRFALNYFSRIKGDTTQKAFLLMSVAASILGLLTLLFSMMFMEQIIEILYGPTWIEVGDIFVLLFGMVVFLPVLELLKAYMYARSKTNGVFWLRFSQISGLIAPLIYFYSTSNLNFSNTVLAISFSIMAGALIPLIFKRLWMGK